MQNNKEKLPCQAFVKTLVNPIESCGKLTLNKNHLNACSRGSHATIRKFGTRLREPFAGSLGAVVRQSASTVRPGQSGQCLDFQRTRDIGLRGSLYLEETQYGNRLQAPEGTATIARAPRREIDVQPVGYAQSR